MGLQPINGAGLADCCERGRLGGRDFLEFCSGSEPDRALVFALILWPTEGT
jgi:hypothetical protein